MKEKWCEAYEATIDDIMEKDKCDYDEAKKILDDLLDEMPGYLDNYWNCYSEIL